MDTTKTPDFSTTLRHALRHRSRRGMNLNEIMIVVAIVVILVSLLGAGAIYAWSVFQGGAQVVFGMNEIATAIESEIMMGGGKPPESLKDLKNMPESKLKDPWGNEYIYEVPGPNGEPFDLVCLGADGSEGGGDDVRYSEAKNR